MQSNLDLVPTGVTLKRTYVFEESDLNRAEDWALPLWRYVQLKVPFSAEVSALRDQELSEVLHERFVSYVFSRLIIGACHALEKAKEQNAGAERRATLMADAVDTVLDVDPDVRDTMVWYLNRIAERVSRGQADLSPGQRKAIVRKATEHGHRCYMCGRTLHYKQRPFGADDTPNIHKIRSKLAFEIEHIWSQARGGGRARTNLAASCNECNKFKRHLVSFADFAVEQIMTTATSPDSIRAAMSGDSRFALIWRQGGCCAVCDENFYDVDSEHLFLVKRETSQPYHFLNMMAVCRNCNSTHQLNGVDLRA